MSLEFLFYKRKVAGVLVKQIALTSVSRRVCTKRTEATFIRNFHLDSSGNAVKKDPAHNTRSTKNVVVNSLYLKLARRQTICSIQREFDIEREKQVIAYTKGPRLQFEIERGSRQRVFEIERVNCICRYACMYVYFSFN